MKIFKLFKEIQAIKDVLALIFSQQNDLNYKLISMQSQLDKIQSILEPPCEVYKLIVYLKQEIK